MRVSTEIKIMSDALANAPFLRACRGEATDYTPIWLNRQAGRYMPEYHAVKGDTPSLDFFKTPHLAAEVTCDAQRILGVDAAILFADLLPILEPMGLKLDYLPGVGPQIANPIRSLADIDNVAVLPTRDTMPYIREAIGLIRAELPADIPLIGFGGAPFTLASYAKAHVIMCTLNV
jgi:uroporphyrinogen decarboxylase